MQTTMTTTSSHAIVSREEWQVARAALLEREKAHTRLGDELARRRQELPWVPDGEGVHAAHRRRTAIAGAAV